MKLWRRLRFEKDMQEEMQLHLQQLAADLEREGLSPAEARRRAHLEFGNVVSLQEQARESVWLHWRDTFEGDVRFVTRSLLRSPLFAATAILTLAIGLAANVLLFSVVDGVLLKPLPFPQGDRLYAIREMVPRFQHLYPDIPVNARHFAEWQQLCSSCEPMALIGVRSGTLSGFGPAQRVEALETSTELFSLLGLQVQLGRPYSPAEIGADRNRVIVISDALWRRSFGTDPKVIGRSVTWNDTPVQIIGVLTPGARLPRRGELGAIVSLPDQVDVLRPLSIEPLREKPTGNHNYAVLVRLKPAARPDVATKELTRSLAPFAQEGFGKGIEARLLHLQTRVSGAVREPLLLLFGAAIALLSIVCLNLGNLMLARAAGRQRDWAIRAALGARTSHLFRQVWLEAALLVAAGAALGLAISWQALILMRRFAPEGFPRLEDVSLDLRTMAFLGLLAALSSAICSAVPIWRLRRTQPQEALRSGSERVSASGLERHARRILVSAEVGLSLVLASLGGLLLVSFLNVRAIDKGFRPEQLLTFEVTLDSARYQKAEQRRQFQAEFLDRLRALPGIAGAALTNQLPLQGEMWVTGIRRKGLPSQMVNMRSVSPGYLTTMGMRLRGGRDFTEADRERGVIVLSQQTAQSLFPGENAVGQEIPAPEGGGTVTVVGVVNEVKTESLEKAAPLTAYMPYWVRSAGAASFVVRGATGEADLIRSARAALAEQDPGIPMHDVKTMDAIVQAALSTRQWETWVAGAFALAGMALASLGIFGVVSYGVTQRTSEIGIRMALGATRGRVLTLVLSETLRVLSAGLGCGLVVTILATRWVASQLYGVAPQDPLILGGTVAIVGAVALAASYWPASRAARLDPLKALRQD